MTNNKRIIFIALLTLVSCDKKDNPFSEAHNPANDPAPAPGQTAGVWSLQTTQSEYTVSFQVDGTKIHTMNLSCGGGSVTYTFNCPLVGNVNGSSFEIGASDYPFWLQGLFNTSDTGSGNVRYPAIGNCAPLSCPFTCSRTVATSSEDSILPRL